MGKIKYKKVKKLKPEEAAYLGGLIDGEGTVTLSNVHINKTRYIVITISNTDYNLLKQVLKTVGAGKITNKKTYKKWHKPSYAFQIYSRQALDVLSQITPYLQTYKKQRAELALNKYIELTPRNGKYNEKIKEDRKKFIDKFFSITESGNKNIFIKSRI